MRTRTNPHPVWFVPGVEPISCPLGAGLLCEIPVTRLSVIAEGRSCHSGNNCLGHNHPNPEISQQAREEFDLRIAHARH